MKKQALVLAVAALCGAAAALAQTPPRLPPAIDALFKAGGSLINADTRCEVIDWTISPGSGMPEDAVRMARRYVDLCVLAHDDVTPETAARRLGGETFRFDVEGNAVTLLAKSSDASVQVCCAPQMKLERIGASDYWAARRRIADPDKAMLSFSIIKPGVPPEGFKTFRGPNAPLKPIEVEIGKWKGQMLERELKSTALGETRQLMIYLPPGYTKDRTWPALFMADSGAVEFAGLVESMIAAGEIDPIVIISAASGEEAVIGTPPTGFDDLRSADYLRFWPDGRDRFDRHMQFFAKELVDFAVAEYGVSANRSDRAVSGKSSGGVLAMWAGVLRGDTFAHAIPMSAGWITLKPEHLVSGDRARFFVSAGKYEPGFIQPAQEAERVLKAAGYDATGRYYAAGHFHDQWAVALRAALIEIFPPN